MALVAGVVGVVAKAATPALSKDHGHIRLDTLTDMADRVRRIMLDLILKNAQYQNEFYIWVGNECIDGSYCTQAPDDTPESVLRRMSDDLFSALVEPQDSDIDFDYDEDGAVHFNDRLM